jgi:hypothetical protein
VTQYWKSALAGAAVVILSATAGAGSASAHELPGTGQTAAAAPANRHGDCKAQLSIRHHLHSGYEIRYGGSSSGWAPSGHLKITAVLMVDGQRMGSVSGTGHGTSVHTRTGTDVRRSMGSVMVKVTADGPAGSVSCQKMSGM